MLGACCFLCAFYHVALACTFGENGTLEKKRQPLFFRWVYLESREPNLARRELRPYIEGTQKNTEDPFFETAPKKKSALVISAFYCWRGQPVIAGHASKPHGKARGFNGKISGKIDGAAVTQSHRERGSEPFLFFLSWSFLLRPPVLRQRGAQCRL